MGDFYLGIAPTHFSHIGTQTIPDRMKNQAKYPSKSLEIPRNDLQEMGKGGEYALTPSINENMVIGVNMHVRR